MDDEKIKKIAESFKKELKKEGLQTIAITKMEQTHNPQSSSCPPVCPCEPVCPCTRVATTGDFVLKCPRDLPCLQHCPIVACSPVCPSFCAWVSPCPPDCPPVGGGCDIVCPTIYPEYSKFQERIRELQVEFNKKYEEAVEEFRIGQDTMIDLRSLEKISKLSDDAFKSVDDVIKRLRRLRKEESD